MYLSMYLFIYLFIYFILFFLGGGHIHRLIDNNSIAYLAVFCITTSVNISIKAGIFQLVLDLFMLH